MQPGGRFSVHALPMRFLISRAFPEYSNDQLVGVPKWADTEAFDITGLAPASAQAGHGDDSADDAGAARGTFQNDVSHRGAISACVLAHIGKTQDEEGRP